MDDDERGFCVAQDLQVRGEAEEKKNVLLSYAATC